jgi:WD40 repeat protein
MKITLFLRCTILTLLICCFSTIAQDSTQFSLPEGAIARLGKGTLGEVHFSPDGSRLAVSSSIGIWFYDPQTGKELDLLDYTNGVPPFAFAYAPDGNTIASGSTSQMTVVTGRTEARLPSIAGNTVQLRDVTSGEKKTTVRLQTQRVASIVHSPDGNTIATSGDYRSNSLQLRDVKTKKLKTTYTEHTNSILTSMVYAPDGKTIAMVNLSDNTVQLWSPGTGKHKATFKHANADRGYDISSVAYSPDGQTLATAGGHYKDHKGTVYLWHAQTMKRKIIYEGPDYISSVAYSPDGRTIATGSWNSKIQVWHTVTGEELKAIPTKHIGGVESLAYSSDGKTIASGGGYRDDIVQLWNATTGKHKTRLRGHTKTVASVVYSPDGKTIASGSTDGTVRFWDAITGEHKATFTAQTDIVSVVYSPDGQTIATRSTDGTVTLWEIKPTLEAE